MSSTPTSGSILITTSLFIDSSYVGNSKWCFVGKPASTYNIDYDKSSRDFAQAEQLESSPNASVSSFRVSNDAGALYIRLRNIC